MSLVSLFPITTIFHFSSFSIKLIIKEEGGLKAVKTIQLFELKFLSSKTSIGFLFSSKEIFVLFTNKFSNKIIIITFFIFLFCL